MLLTWLTGILPGPCWSCGSFPWALRAALSTLFPQAALPRLPQPRLDLPTTSRTWPPSGHHLSFLSPLPPLRVSCTCCHTQLFGWLLRVPSCRSPSEGQTIVPLHTNKLDNLEEMDRLLERHNLPRLNREEIENMNRQLTSEETKTVIKISQQRKAKDQMVSLANSIKYLMKN